MKRKAMKQMILCGMSAAVVAVGLAGAAAAQVAPPKELVNPGKVTYGVAATFAPFEYMQDGKLVGFDIEMLEALARKMGLGVEIMNMEFKGLIPALQSKRIDLINSAMYIRPEREEQVDFVPYLTVGNEIVVQLKNPRGIKGREDMCGVKMAVTLGGFQEKLAREDDETCKKAGKPGVDVMTFPTAQDAALALKNGRADAIYNSTPGAYKQVQELPNDFAIAGKTFGPYATIGIAVRKGDAGTREAIGKAVAAIRADGAIDTLLKKYGLPASAKLD
jgi:polar amino acid transport system substrate-binding protein